MPVEKQLITVIKRNPQGQETWRYNGSLLEHQDNRLVVEAYFDRQDMLFHGMPLLKGDRFVETYYTDRWYNIYEIHDRESNLVRGWYCNVCLPAIYSGETVEYTDLALDVLVFPDGRRLVLDEEEFARLDIPPKVRERALKALDELKGLNFT